MTSIDDIARLLTEKGAVRYGSEPVNQLDHALQCAALAERADSSDTLITAALLHDIGHLIEDDEGAAMRGLDMRHEELGARFLKSLFASDVTEPVRLHVDAKRYLCTTNARYASRLSPASVQSLNIQGGPYGTAQVEDFTKHPHSGAAVLLRVWDDLAKTPNAKTPPLSHFLDRAQRVLAGPGRLILVVGPSGAGKDTLIAAARAHHAHDAHFVFPKRVVTRPCAPGVEQHESVSEPEFKRMVANHAFWLHWQAHGLHYGIPHSAGHAIAEGRTVVVNVSRRVADSALNRFHRVQIVHVTAPRDVLLARLAARGRPTDGAPADRLDRDVAVPNGTTANILNDGPVQKSISAFLDAIAAAP